MSKAKSLFSFVITRPLSKSEVASVQMLMITACKLLLSLSYLQEMANMPASGISPGSAEMYTQRR